MHYDGNCITCGKTWEQSTDGALHSNGFEGLRCWDCWHKHAIEKGVVDFRNAVIGDNSGWTYQYTLPKAIETALYEIEMQQNMDMGITVDASIGGSYMATAIVRNHQLYVRMADLSELEDMGHDDRIAYIENIVKQLTFELLRQPKD